MAVSHLYSYQFRREELKNMSSQKILIHCCWSTDTLGGSPGCVKEPDAH